MIVYCPSCSTRHDIPTSRLAASGGMVRCSGCGQNWIEGKAAEVEELPSRHAPRVIEHGFEPDSEVRRLLEASREARDRFAAQRRRRLSRIRGWSIFAALVAAPFAAAAALPEMIVTYAPASIRAYQAIGMEVNIYGLDIRRVQQQHAIVDGTRVLSIKGEIVNVTDDPVKMPWLRFGLSDTSGAEVYFWTLDTGARPLRAGESTTFTTRVAAPPESARKLHIRFARASEIGSNSGP
jgi:predicted Zn finger-like uncharacterized protein